jgi:hypothetical protein
LFFRINDPRRQGERSSKRVDSGQTVKGSGIATGCLQPGDHDIIAGYFALQIHLFARPMKQRVEKYETSEDLLDQPDTVVVAAEVSEFVNNDRIHVLTVNNCGQIGREQQRAVPQSDGCGAGHMGRAQNMYAASAAKPPAPSVYYAPDVGTNRSCLGNHAPRFPQGGCETAGERQKTEQPDQGERGGNDTGYQSEKAASEVAAACCRSNHVLNLYRLAGKSREL